MSSGPQLAGKTAWVTGGGAGIGAAVAEAFAAAGASVVVTGRRQHLLDEVVGRITDRGGAALAVAGNVADLDSTAAAVQSGVDRFGRLDIVVANAAVQPRRVPVLDYSPAEWQQVLTTNLTGVWHTAKASLAALQQTGGGSMILIGSGMARASTPGSGSYAVAKAGVSALTRVLARELRRHDIAVNELVPGPTRTPGMGMTGTESDRAIEERWREVGEWFKDPEEVARLAVFIATLPPWGPTGQVFSLAGRLL